MKCLVALRGKALDLWPDISTVQSSEPMCCLSYVSGVKLGKLNSTYDLVFECSYKTETVQVTQREDM
jgi:hypothetical protein